MDPIADMFSQLKNARVSNLETLTTSYSKTKMAVLAILKSQGYIDDFRETQKNHPKQIEINLSQRNFSYLKRVSRPGRRVYSSHKSIPRPKNPLGLVIISTPEGIMVGEDARKKGLGGEIMAELA